jgi:hypothetical protein
MFRIYLILRYSYGVTHSERDDTYIRYMRYKSLYHYLFNAHICPKNKSPKTQIIVGKVPQIPMLIRKTN